MSAPYIRMYLSLFNENMVTNRIMVQNTGHKVLVRTVE